MRRCAGFLAASALLLGPLNAQDQSQSSAPFAPEEDLDCAIYVSAIMAETQAEMTPESRAALTGAFTYFIGRYEAQRGQLSPQTMLERYPIYAERDPQEVQQTCSIRARTLGERLQRIGRAMVEAGEDQVSQPSPD